MAILQKTREKAGMAVSIIIALALLSFIIDPTTLETAMQAMSSKNDVGEINGKSISYVDFQQEVERFSAITEMTTGSSAQTEQQQEQARNAAWQNMLDKYLFLKKAKAAGINVGEEEMKDLVSGDMVSPVIANNPAFLDENGVFSKEAIVNFISNVQQDQTGRLKAYWDYIQNTVYNQQFYAKYGSLFVGSNLQNPVMMRRTIAENNNTNNVDFVLVPSTFAPDSTITVSDAEITKFYNDHKKMFKQTASRDIEYVVYEVKPSQEDIDAANDAMTAVYEEFKTTDNLKSFLARNSEESLSTHWYKEGELASSTTQEIDDFIFANAEGTSPVMSDNNNVFYSARIVQTAQIPDSAFVRHILLAADLAAKADSLIGELSKGASFSTLAASFSSDSNSAADGELGNIGWMTQAYMIPGFESVLTAQTGKPYVVKTQYGTHIVEVTKKSAPILKKQVAVLAKTSVASNQTFNEYYSKATKFANLAAGGYSDYKAAVDTLGVYSHPMSNVLESTSTYGTISQAKEITRWVFDAKKGKVSDIITVNNNYFFVVALTGIHKEGTATLAEVKESVRQRLYAEKYSEKAAEKVAEKINGLDDLQAIADALNSTVSSGVDVRFTTMNGQGFDPKFLGAVAVATEGKISGPVAGSFGTYVFKLNSREMESFYTEDDAKNNANQMNSYMTQMILPVMMSDVDVKDNRARFY